jgi:NarL family two-component system response regulator LiaR
MTVRIVIVDDHHVVREALRLLLNLDPDIEVVGEAADGAAAVRLARDLHPDLVLIDLAMPVMDGITATATIRREIPTTEVLALTSVLDDTSIAEAIKAGAIGYLLKDTHATTLCSAVKAAAEGQVQLSPRVAASLARQIAPPEEKKALSERERDVLRLVAHGKTNKEIGRELQLGSETVKTHVSNILAKLSVHGRTEAALQAVRMGLVRSDDVGRS